MKVELDLFSGRPNPSWELTGAERAELLRRLRVLPRDTATRTLPDEGKLGYRGLRVTSDSDALVSFESLLVVDGMVVSRHAGTTQSYVDQERTLERWLLGTGQAHLEPELYRQVTQTLHQP